MIPSTIEAEIIRLYHAEHWKVGTISRQLGLHHGTIERILYQEGLIRPSSKRQTIIEPYWDFVLEVLEKFPTLSASRLYQMVCARGYPGGEDHFRHLVSQRRPKKPAEAYLRVRTLPGEQAQVDWGHFGKVTIGRALRPLLAFVMVLSYSRMTFLRFYLDAKMPNFLRGHVDAFDHFGGVARVLLYDNLKSAVLERHGDAIRFHPKLLELKAYYHFDPKPVAVARGNEKGRVERKIRHIRESFFAAREFTDLDDLNRQALDWCTGLAANRPCPEDKTRTVREVFTQEKPKLLPLPQTPFDAEERIEVSVRKQPYVRFDLNDYSIPFDHVQRILEVRANLKQIRIFDGYEQIAKHERSFDKGCQIENPEHIEGLRDYKQKAKARSVLDLLHRAAPSVGELYEYAATKNKSLLKMTRQLHRLLQTYGAEHLEEAICLAIENGTLHVGAVHQLLEIKRQAQNQPPPILSGLSKNPKTQNITVKNHDLKTYDNLTKDNDDEQSNT